MANLAITGSHAVNGVAKLHTDILRNTTFRDFEELFPGRISNKTNGVTPRRWLFKANPGLSALITESIGTAWISDLEQLSELEKFVEDISFRELRETHAAVVIAVRLGRGGDPERFCHAGPFVAADFLDEQPRPACRMAEQSCIDNRDRRPHR